MITDWVMFNLSSNVLCWVDQWELTLTLIISFRQKYRTCQDFEKIHGWESQNTHFTVFLISHLWIINHRQPTTLHQCNRHDLTVPPNHNHFWSQFFVYHPKQIQRPKLIIYDEVSLSLQFNHEYSQTFFTTIMYYGRWNMFDTVHE